jgi:hypothetical protein
LFRETRRVPTRQLLRRRQSKGRCVKSGETKRKNVDGDILLGRTRRDLAVWRRRYKQQYADLAAQKQQAAAYRDGMARFEKIRSESPYLHSLVTRLMTRKREKDDFPVDVRRMAVLMSSYGEAAIGTLQGSTPMPRTATLGTAGYQSSRH